MFQNRSAIRRSGVLPSAVCESLMSSQTRSVTCTSGVSPFCTLQHCATFLQTSLSCLPHPLLPTPPPPPSPQSVCSCCVTDLIALPYYTCLAVRCGLACNVPSCCYTAPLSTSDQTLPERISWRILVLQYSFTPPSCTAMPRQHGMSSGPTAPHAAKLA